MPRSRGAGWARNVFDMANIQGLAVALHGVPNAYGWLGHAHGIVDSGTVTTVYGNSDNVPLYPWPTDAVALEVVSDNIADDIGSTGGRTLLFIGIDDNWDIKSEEIDLDGTTPVALSGTWLRALRAIVRTAGANGTNVGRITVNVDGGPTDGDILQIVPAEWGESSDGVISVPNNFVGIPVGIASLLRGNKATIWSDCIFRVREGGGENDEAWRIRDRLEPFSGDYRPFVPPPLYGEKSDFEVRSIDASGSNVEVYVAVSMLIVNKTQIPAEFLTDPQIFERGG